ncbi:MAG TPA: hypothetical protein DCL77_16540 [Prolixibacteraceae bacterium]|nr:hypothetical protein [Prolixibacteraceae bacterium]
MEISNQKRCKRIKRSFNITGIVIVLVGLVFLWMKQDISVMITVGVFIVYVGISQFANLCYVYFSTANEKILIKYYPIISLMKKEYDAIEFAQKSLVGFQMEKAMGFSDLQIAIKTKRGVAEYPSISLAALNKAEIEQIRSALTEIIGNSEVKFAIKEKK